MDIKKLQRAHGVERVARAGALELDAVEHEARFAFDGECGHGLAVGCVGEPTCLLPGLASGDPAHLIKC